MTTNDIIINIIICISTGIITGLIVTIGAGIVSKVISEKKELDIACQGYIRYCQDIRIALLTYKKDRENGINEIKKAIYLDPYYYGFEYTDSKVLGKMNDTISEIEDAICEGTMDSKKANKYLGTLQKIRFEISCANYKFRIRKEKELIRMRFKYDKNGNPVCEETYGR